jgi:hypothetical protein
MHGEVLSAAAAREFPKIGGLAAAGGFVLVGGTALALHLGHRRSDDLDFFRNEGFEPQTLVEQLAQAYPTGLQILDAGHRDTLHLVAGGVKISFLRQTGGHLRDALDYNGARVAQVGDLAAMKVNAISTRGAKKDFIDLYFAAQSGFPFPAMLGAALTVFPRMNPVHILKSFTYFEDADADPTPLMLKPCSWPQVKRFFTDAAVSLQLAELTNSPHNRA